MHAPDLATTAATPRVRQRFHPTDLDASSWATTQYGTATLVDASLAIDAAFRVHYPRTLMSRDAPFRRRVSLSGGTVRVCNTHNPWSPTRPSARTRCGPRRGTCAGKRCTPDWLRGTFSAIQPFDRTLHADNGLRDAFLEVGGEEDAERGYTWGQQAATKLREKFRCSRIDKVYFCGCIEVVGLERFGADVLTVAEEEGREIVALGFEKAWVTDHLGIRAQSSLEEWNKVEGPCRLSRRGGVLRASS